MVFFYRGGDEGIDFVSLHSPWLIRVAHRPTLVCLSPAGRTLFRVRIYIIDDKNKMPGWAFDFCGGDEGIRTLDTLASIPHFQCGALDQLCDVSGFFYSSPSDASGVSSPASSTPSVVSSIKEFSNSASISRNIGSSLAISKDTSSSTVLGVSL